jgi:hypothetical protein
MAGATQGTWSDFVKNNFYGNQTANGTRSMIANDPTNKDLLDFLIRFWGNPPVSGNNPTGYDLLQSAGGGAGSNNATATNQVLLYNLIDQYTNAYLNGISINTNGMLSRMPISIGQKASAGSSSVVIASDQTVPVSASALPLPAGAASAANQNTMIGRLPSDSVFGFNKYTRGNFYSCVFDLTPASNPTDIVEIVGSASKTTVVTVFNFLAKMTASTIVRADYIRRSAANTAGTSTSPVLVPWNNSNPTATTTIKAYTANPTLGTVLAGTGIVNTVIGTVPTIASVPFGITSAFLVDIDGFGMEVPSGQSLCLNLEAATLAGLTGTCIIRIVEI